MALCKNYGHNTLYALYGSNGFLCHSFYADGSIQGVLLFTDTKGAKSWLNKAKKQGWHMPVLPHPITAYPDELRATINPAEDGPAIDILVKKSFYRNW